MEDNGSAVTEEAQGDDPRKYVLRLYITGATPRSARAIANLKAICVEYLHNCYDLEVIDLYEHPERAAEAQLVAAPTLIKELPEPLRRLIGDLSDTEQVLVGLNVIVEE
jgi:circadian clock protein KaiB